MMSNSRQQKEPTACLCLVLHAHLPYVRHPEYKNFLEEDWLFEAITETYLRLVGMLASLHEDKIPFRMSLSITPTLLGMLRDPLLLDRYERRLENQKQLVALEEKRTRKDSDLHKAAWFYVDLINKASSFYHDRCGRDLVATFAEEAAEGNLELLGSSATHAILPLLKTDAARRAQVRTARRAYRRHFGTFPKGFWLPECAYEPGLDQILSSEGISHFFLEASSIELGLPRPRAGIRAAIATPGGCYAFGRDQEVARQVWGSREGFPGNPNYREFYRDLAFDADIKYLSRFLHPDRVRRPLGIKYHRITGLVPLYAKKPWNPEVARTQARTHAREFVSEKIAEAKMLRRSGDPPPLIVATFDAELFGHWWFEGPWFVEELFREMAARRWELAPITPTEWLGRYGAEQKVEPQAGTWGVGSAFSTWLNPDNAWIWRHLHSIEREMAKVAAMNPAAHGSTRRALDQALRELLLAQSSDWPFIMTRRTMVSYAVKRFREHTHNFHVLIRAIESGAIDDSRLGELEARYPFSPEIDYRDFS